MKSIIWAKQYVSNLSSEINNTCSRKNITLNSSSNRPIYRNMRADVEMLSSAKQSSNIPVPQSSKNSLSITPHYVLECK